MSVAIGVIVGVLVVLLIAALVALMLKKRAQRRRELQEMYGPEYDRAVQQSGSRRAAERELAERHEQRSQLEIVPLSPSSRTRYTQAWDELQGRFVDDPQGAVADADELVTSVMRERGYPTEGFDEQARLLSVDHANTLDNYRQGHHIGTLAKQRQATTEQLRQGMMHYRSLFQELVNERPDEPGGGSDGSTGGQRDFAADSQPTTEYARPHQPQAQPIQEQPSQGQPMQQPHQQYAHPQQQPVQQQYAQPQQQQYAQPQQQPVQQQYAQPVQPPHTEPVQQHQPLQGQPQQGQPQQGQPLPPTAPPPPIAPDEATQPVTGQMQPGQMQPGQMQPGQPAEQLQGEPYPTDGSMPQDEGQHGEGLRRRTGGAPTGNEGDGYQR